MKRFFILAVIMLFVSACGTTKVIKNEEPVKNSVKVKGTIFWASFDSAIELPNDGDIGFLTESEVGNKIFEICKHGDMCEITGTLVDHGNDGFYFFDSVSEVRKIGD